MFVVIVGCSVTGYYLSKALITGGHEVVVIEQEHSRFQLLNEELGSAALLGDGTEVATLRRAGVSRAEVVIALTGVDATNLVVCQMAQHIFQAPRTMALVKDPKNEPLFEELGVTEVVNSVHLALAALEERVPGRPLVHLMNLRVPGMELVSVSIPEDANIVGRQLGEVELPPSSFVSLVVKSGRAELPDNRTVVESDDQIVAVTTTGDEHILYDILTGA